MQFQLQNCLTIFGLTPKAVPKFLHRFTTPLSQAPVSHITSFLLLHELTAIIPLFSLAAFFHYSNWLPPYITEGAWVREGVERFGGYFRRKGWLGSDGSKRDKGWTFGEQGVRVLFELATAWAVVKALLPLRLVVSVWATPWFARVFVLPITGRIGRLFRGRGKSTVASKSMKAAGTDAAKTGATAAGAVPKDMKK